MTTTMDPRRPVETTDAPELAAGEAERAAQAFHPSTASLGSVGDAPGSADSSSVRAHAPMPASPKPASNEAPASGQPMVASRYRLIEPLGRGGMGRVYRGHDDLLDRPVAVKLIYDDAVSLRDLQRSCAVEARAAARLSHPGIVRILDSGFDDGRCFVVMELAHGRTLAERLRERGAEPVGEALNLAAQVADALEAAHRHGVVHCDVKPGNLVVDDYGRVCLVDFGIARITSSSSSLTDQDIHGSARYVAPEQVEGLDVDGRTDLYSLGVVLFEMLAGQAPFAGGNLASILAQRLVADPPSVRTLDSSIPIPVDAIVRTAMAREPDDRYQAAGAFRDALRAAREGLRDTVRLPTQDIVLPVPPVPPVPVTWRERRPSHSMTVMLGRLAGAAAALGAVGAVGAVGAAVLGRAGRTLAAWLQEARRSVGMAGAAIGQTGGRARPILASFFTSHTLGWPSLPAAVGIVALLGLVVGMAAAQCGVAGTASGNPLGAQPVSASTKVLAAPVSVEPTSAPATAPTTAPTVAAEPTQPDPPTAIATPVQQPAAAPAQLLSAPASAAAPPVTKPQAPPPGQVNKEEQPAPAPKTAQGNNGNGNGNKQRGNNHGPVKP